MNVLVVDAVGHTSRSSAKEIVDADLLELCDKGFDRPMIR
jgi:hypothetical protein